MRAVPLFSDEQTREDRVRRRKGHHDSTVIVTPTGPRPGGGGRDGGGSGPGGPASQDGPGQTPGTSASATSGSSSSSSSKSERKLGQSYLDQAGNLQVQAKALRHALNIDLKGALKTKLGDVNQVLHEQQRILMDGYRRRVGSLEGAFEDNEKAASSATTAANQNRLRERNNALNQIAVQGAGESDAMNAQLMSLRNWNANQGEVERTRYDTLRSINSSLTDLNVDTKTARVNNVLQAQADKSQLWTNFYNQKSEIYTSLGNTLGQIADYQDTAKAYGVGGGSGANDGAGAFMNASKALGQSYDAPGISNKLMKWKGHDDFEIKKPKSLSAQLHSAPSVDLGKAPEGATLRAW